MNAKYLVVGGGALLLVILVAHLPGTVLGRAGWAALAGIIAFRAQDAAVLELVRLRARVPRHGSARPGAQVLFGRADPGRADEEVAPAAAAAW